VTRKSHRTIKGASLATSEIRQSRNKEVAHRSAIAKDDQAALYKCLLLIEAFRAIRRIMPLQEAYAFLFVASEEGCSVSEYAQRADVTQAVMTRILFALGSRGRQRNPGYGLVQQAMDLQDSRKRLTFLTMKGKALMHEIARLVRSDRPRANKLRPMTNRPQRDLVRDQWLSRLIAAGHKLKADDIQLAVRQLELLIDHRQSTRPRRRPTLASWSRAVANAFLPPIL
jgi:DNA-binding MarR family transcriptional regulator